MGDLITEVHRRENPRFCSAGGNSFCDEMATGNEAKVSRSQIKAPPKPTKEKKKTLYS